MTATEFTTFNFQSAQDPTLSPLMLGQLAQARPDLHAAILQNPQCSAELREWITSQDSASPVAYSDAPAAPSFPPVCTEW